MKTSLHTFDANNVVLPIELPDGRKVRMRLDRYGVGLPTTAVALVSAPRFLALWRASPRSLHVAEANMSLDQWRASEKYADAERCLVKSAHNPVPVGQIGSVTIQDERERRDGWLRRTLVYERVPNISFVDGMTRTAWLILNRAPRIPVDCCSLEDALVLHRFLESGDDARTYVAAGTVFDAQLATLSEASECGDRFNSMVG